VIARVISDVWVAVAAGANSAVWGAIVVALLTRGWLLFAVAAALVAAAFDSLALAAMAPHILAALNAGSMVLAIVLAESPLSARDQLGLGLVLCGSIAGVATVQERASAGDRGQYTWIYAAGGLGAVAAGVAPAAVLQRRGRSGLGGSSARLALPVVTGLLSLVSTTVASAVSSGAPFWGLWVQLGVGGCELGIAYLSLGVNRVRHHEAVHFAVWSAGLLATDSAGRYGVSGWGAAVQFGLMGAGIALVFGPLERPRLLCFGGGRRGSKRLRRRAGGHELAAPLTGGDDVTSATVLSLPGALEPPHGF
jgi:hypothetical protein